MNYLLKQIKEQDITVDPQPHPSATGEKTKPKDLFDSMFDGIRENMESTGLQEFDIASSQVNMLSYTLGAGFSVQNQNAQNNTMSVYQGIKSRIDFSKVDANDWKLSRTGFLNHKADSLSANIWYGEYVSKNGPLTFPKAIELLKDSTLAPENAEFIKTAFGICDGDVLNNKQGSVGSCHLLSSVNEFQTDENPEMKQILKDMIKQNDDGTVTVTFRGNKDENGNPIPITITNAEIAASYQTMLNTLGGSSDPDSVALELAYIKYSQLKSSEVNEKCTVPLSTVQGISLTGISVECASGIDKAKVWDGVFINYGNEPEGTLYLLTGKETDRTFDTAEIDSLMKNNAWKKSPMLVGFKSDNNNQIQGIISEHAYGLRNIYKDSNGEQKVVVYNPHGYEVEMTYAEFMARVNDVAYINEYVQK